MHYTIIFDLNGVLAYRIWENLLLDKKDGLIATYKIPYEKASLVGENLNNKYACMIPDHGLPFEHYEQRFWFEFLDNFSDEMVDSTVEKLIEQSLRYIKIIRGMGDLLKHLYKNGFDLYLCSNTNVFWFERQYMSLGINKYISRPNCILSCSTGFTKSDRQGRMFEILHSILRVKPEKCLFVDDTMKNVERAQNWGFNAVYFPQESKYGARYLKQILSVISSLE